MMIKMIASVNGGYDCENVWLMPQGITTEQFDNKLIWLADEAKKRNWNVTDRLHIRLWGSKRGV